MSFLGSVSVHVHFPGIFILTFAHVITQVISICVANMGTACYSCNHKCAGYCQCLWGKAIHH